MPFHTYIPTYSRSGLIPRCKVHGLKKKVQVKKKKVEFRLYFEELWNLVITGCNVKKEREPRLALRFSPEVPSLEMGKMIERTKKAFDYNLRHST